LGRTLISGLDKQVIIADKAEKDAIAIDAVVPHHLLDTDIPRARALVDDVLNEIRVASHADNPIERNKFTDYSRGCQDGIPKIGAQMGKCRQIPFVEQINCAIFVLQLTFE
jgi:hypothetical protein